MLLCDSASSQVEWLHCNKYPEIRINSNWSFTSTSLDLGNYCTQLAGLNIAEMTEAGCT